MGCGNGIRRNRDTGRCRLLIGVLTVWGALSQSRAEEFVASAPEARAMAYLSREVPRWMQENRCFSCHNNGDAARALYQAAAFGAEVDRPVLEETTRWLERPEGWERNGGDGPFSDKILARIQIAAVLGEAIESGRSRRQDVLMQAAEKVAADQTADGSWQVDAGGTVGSPAAYGSRLATVMARRSLIAADSPRFTEAVGKADRWLRRVPLGSVLDAAAVLIGLEGAADPDALAQRARGLALIRKGEGSRGGWGPYAGAPVEPFDTAVVLLALARSGEAPERDGWIQRGRAALIGLQLADGSWPETTRPADGESYAQRLSTAGWSLQALLAKRDHRPDSAVVRESPEHRTAE